jgi:hypothetical protein
VNTKSPSRLSRWSAAAAGFGASCNLLILILTFYQDGGVQHIRPGEWRMIILFTANMLAPSLVLLAFRHSFAVTLIYAAMLLWILVWRIEYPHQYYAGRKYDDPGVTLVFLGLISAAVFSAWAAVRLFVFIWRQWKPNRTTD